MSAEQYSEEHIRTLEWQEHIRLRPGMYIGKLGDGTSFDDGIYILFKEVVDNSIDEFVMGHGDTIKIDIAQGSVSVRDYGRGIPLTKLKDVASKMNTGAKYDSKAFKKSVGLNGVGIKAVNALSASFTITAYRDGQQKQVIFSKGKVVEESDIVATSEKNGTSVIFTPDETIFQDYFYQADYVIKMIKNYIFLNTGLKITYSDQTFISEHGLRDLLSEHMDNEPLYPIIHLKGDDIELALTHSRQYGEEYYSYVNGQYTTQGGTHLAACREVLVKTIRDFYGKNFEASDIHTSILCAISIKVEEPVFESQTKTKLGSKEIAPGGTSVRQFVNEFLSTALDNYLHKNTQTSEQLLTKIQANEKERKAISGVKKLARERAKKVNLHNKKLRDCKVHYNKTHKLSESSSIFITEGDSASGSITKARDVATQAVFSLRGKPLNVYNLTKKIVYENEEFNLLQAALNIENGLENLRYNKVIIATDADDDGMHIRLLIITFFLQFFPELIQKGHLHILQTPLFRVRNRKETRYCYTDDERIDAIQSLTKPEITRFKGLGEISPEEFKQFIGEKMRLERILLNQETSIKQLLTFYMGKNTPDRQSFIIDNLHVEKDEELAPHLFG